MSIKGRNHDAMMSAAVYHEFGGPIRVEQIAVPHCPDDGVVVRVHAVGVCRSDWHGWQGHDSDIIQHGLPFVPGHEVSGVVVETRVLSHFRPGDRVAVPFLLSCGRCQYCVSDRTTICADQKQPGFTQYGGFAEYMAVPRAVGHLCRLPPNVTFVQAAALGCRFSTAYRAVLHQGQLRQQDSIAVFGCGGLGLSCIVLAVAHGCTTIVAVDVSRDSLDQAKVLGATHVVLDNSNNDDDDESVRSQVRDAAPGGVHVTIEASGWAAASANAVHCTRPGGRMVQVGLVKDHPFVQVPMDMVAAKEITLVGSHGFAAASDLPALLNMVDRGDIDPCALIGAEVTLEQGAQAIEDMSHGSPRGMIMVTKFPKASLHADEYKHSSITSRL